MALARKHGRPFEYLGAKLRKEDAARKVVKRDGITDGLVCRISIVEPCRRLSLRFTTGQPYVQSAKRNCLHLHYCFMDRDLGLVHVRVQTWLPLQIQVYLNGHEWLARRLTDRNIEHTKIDNVFAGSMAVRPHGSGWRMMVCTAPLLGLAFMLWAVLQGEPELARSLRVHQALSVAAALGAPVGAGTWRRMTAIPAVHLAQARPGLVTLKGRAQPLPGDAPLLSPNGKSCLWFHQSERVMRRIEASDSVRPFLLVDDTGSVVVLPVGAEIHGSSKQLRSIGAPRMKEVSDISGAGDSGSTDAERLLREGDEVEVVACFVAASAEAIELQVQANALAQREFVPRVVALERPVGLC